MSTFQVTIKCDCNDGDYLESTYYVDKEYVDKLKNILINTNQKKTISIEDYEFNKYHLALSQEEIDFLKDAMFGCGSSDIHHGYLTLDTISIKEIEVISEIEFYRGTFH